MALEIIEPRRTRIIGICTARGGSARLPDKNMRMFAGRPLVAWTVLQAMSALSLDEFWVTSDSEHVLECVDHYGARTFLRQREPDDAPGWVPYCELLEKVAQPEDIFVGLFATSPHRKVDDIDNAVRKYMTSPNCSEKMLCSVEKIHEDFRWRVLNDDCAKPMPPDGFETCRYSGLVHVSTRAYYERVVHGEVEPYYIPYFIDQWQALDINTPEQLRFCELMFYDRILQSGFDPYRIYRKGGVKT